MSNKRERVVCEDNYIYSVRQSTHSIRIMVNYT